MTRISKNLFVAAALLAAPASAFAQDADQPADDTATTTTTEGGDGAATAPATTTEDSGGSVSATASTAPGSGPIVDRSLTLNASKLAFQADLGIAHASISIAGMSASNTSEGLLIGAGYGINDKLTVGGTYGFTLNEFEIKGPLTLYGAYNITDNGKLSVAGSADIMVQPTDGDTFFGIDAGLAVRYKVAPKFAVYTGNPYTPGPSGQHLHLGLSGDESKTFAIPVGVAFQATPQLYLHADTTLATILLSDPGAGSRVVSYGDTIPFSVGAWFNVNKGLDVGGSFNTDFKGVGDFWTILLGGRYYL